MCQFIENLWYAHCGCSKPHVARCAHAKNQEQPCEGQLLKHVAGSYAQSKCHKCRGEKDKHKRIEADVAWVCDQLEVEDFKTPRLQRQYMRRRPVMLKLEDDASTSSKSPSRGSVRYGTRSNASGHSGSTGKTSVGGSGSGSSSIKDRLKKERDLGFGVKIPPSADVNAKGYTRRSHVTQFSSSGGRVAGSSHGSKGAWIRPKGKGSGLSGGSERSEKEIEEFQERSWEAEMEVRRLQMEGARDEQDSKSQSKKGPPRLSEEQDVSEEYLQFEVPSRGHKSAPSASKAPPLRKEKHGEELDRQSSESERSPKQAPTATQQKPKRGKGVPLPPMSAKDNLDPEGAPHDGERIVEDELPSPALQQPPRPTVRNEVRDDPIWDDGWDVVQPADDCRDEADGDSRSQYSVGGEDDHVEK